jgi:serine/threonine protein kinase
VQEHPGAQGYSFVQVIAMTNNFKQTLGEGSFGTVYYGKLPDGQEVAVKRLSPNSQQGANEFYNEVNYFLTLINSCCSQTIIMFHSN